METNNHCTYAARALFLVLAEPSLPFVSLTGAFAVHTWSESIWLLNIDYHLTFLTCELYKANVQYRITTFYLAQKLLQKKY